MNTYPPVLIDLDLVRIYVVNCLGEFRGNLLQLGWHIIDSEV